MNKTVKYVSISPQEVEAIYRCIGLAMDWRDAFDEELVEEKGWDETIDYQTKRDWLSKNIGIALMTAHKLAGYETGVNQ
jgi:hypothetical protein